jgi:hypothetical protein
VTLEEDMINILRPPTKSTLAIRGTTPGMDVIIGWQAPLKQLPSKNLDLERQLASPN